MSEINALDKFALDESSRVRRACLPTRMHVLHITTREQCSWLADALAADSASDVSIEESVGDAAGLARLRDEGFDIVFVQHDPAELDALELIDGLRAGGTDEPIIVLGSDHEKEIAALCYEVGADAYVCIESTTTRTLLWTAARAIERCALVRENRQLAQAERQRLQLEHQEAERLLAQQRSMISDLEAISRGEDSLQLGNADQPLAGFAGNTISTTAGLSNSLVTHYRELLRAYVIMGSGNLAGEMRALGKLLVSTGVTAQQTMFLHLQVLEELVRGLGSRSARHVMSRADLLVLEVMMHVADGYRERQIEH